MEDFNKLASSWDDEPRRVERAKVIANEIIEVVPNLNKMSAFEYGCGTGLLSLNLSNNIKKITLADSSERMLSVLEQKIEKNNIINMKTQKLDLTTDEIPRERYDLIYNLMVLHHVSNLDKVFKAFYEMLNSQGYLCIADLDEEDGSFHGKDFSGHNGFNREKLAEELKCIGFNNVTFKNSYEMKKNIDGNEKVFTVFFMIAQK